MRCTIALVLAVLAASPAWGQTAAEADLAAEVSALRQRIAALEAREQENWLTAERAEQIKALASEAIADARARSQALDDDVQAGYKNGFFIQGGPNFRLAVLGYLQFRYTYANVNVENEGDFPESREGDINGFDFRRARLYFVGHAFDPRLTFAVSGDFAGAGTFTTLDNYVQYKFSEELLIRAGSFLVPFTHVEIAGPGIQTSEGPTVFFPFDPVRALGVSVFGQLVKDKVSYEFNVNNGSRAHHLRRVTTVGTSPNFDNRLAYYTRWQYAGGAGKLADFADESDLAWTKEFAWMVGFAAGYESQNTNASAFPSPQTATTVYGIGNPDGPGFVAPINLNGDLYRATVDVHAKYQGWGLTAAAYYQHADFADGTPADVTSAFGGGVTNIGYYAQAGYFVIPKKLELVARFGQLVTCESSDTMEEYTIGANYFMFGHNLKLQTDITYIPGEAAFSDVNAGTVINTSNLIYRLQLQLKF